MSGELHGNVMTFPWKKPTLQGPQRQIGKTRKRTRWHKTDRADGKITFILVKGPPRIFELFFAPTDRCADFAEKCGAEWPRGTGPCRPGIDLEFTWSEPAGAAIQAPTRRIPGRNLPNRFPSGFDQEYSRHAKTSCTP